MARTRSPRRLDEIVEAALQVFLEQGYRRALMADIARRAGVSPGLLYSYAESKDALFALALQRELGLDTSEITLPYPDPDPSDVDALLERALRDFGTIPTLQSGEERRTSRRRRRGARRDRRGALRPDLPLPDRHQAGRTLGARPPGPREPLLHARSRCHS